MDSGRTYYIHFPDRHERDLAYESLIRTIKDHEIGIIELNQKA